MARTWMRWCGLAALALAAGMASAGDRPAAGAGIPAIGPKGSADGFSGLLMVTPDADWKEKWDTPASETPRFNTTDEVARGGKVFVLIFLANPGLGADGSADVTCDLEVLRPDATLSSHQDGVMCFKARPQGPATNVYLAAPVVVFTGDPGDPAGAWTVRVTLRDNIRHVNVPLATSFTLK